MTLKYATLVETKRVFDAHNGDKVAAALQLGINPRTIEHRLNKLRSMPVKDNEETTEQLFIDDVPAPGTNFVAACQEYGYNPDDVRAIWVKTEQASVYLQNKGFYGDTGQVPVEQMRDKIIAEMQVHSPVYAPIVYSPIVGEHQHLLIIDPADVHIGKYVVKDTSNGGYDIKEAVRRLETGVVSLVEKAAVFNLERIVLVIGNDILHVDNSTNTTTKGTRQDTDGYFWQMFLAAKKAYIRIIEHLAVYAPVTIVFNPSNHDYVSGWMLADTIYSWFNKHPSVSFGHEQTNIDLRDRKYIVYGNNLIGFTHGDGAKEHDLQHLMQYEARKEWGETKYAYMYSHHLHHKIKTSYNVDGKRKVQLEKDKPGITVINTGLALDPTRSFTVEVLRSPSSSDPWHSKNGHVNHQAIEAFLHHPANGQIARFTQHF
ncbi:hypothetical protein EVB91_080 [Rhizobium phage RHph_I1_18]|nr:hypothetical protein EVB91_080 [Rhizobium phage RHph_I1_18]